MEDALDGQEAVAEVRLGGGARAHARARLPEQVELAPVGVRRVHDGGSTSQAAAVGEELDRPHAVLGDALLDLARLFVRVDVQRQTVLVGVAAELDEPVARARTNGVGRDPDADAGVAELFEPAQVLGHRALPEASDAAARVRDVEEDERDPRPSAASGAACASGSPR